MRGCQRQRAVFRLASRQSLLRHFNAVVHAVAHQMGQRVSDLFDQALVQLGGFAQCDEVHLLAQLARQITQHAREATEHGGHGNHADRHHGLLQIPRVAIQIGQPRQQLLISRRVQTLAVLRQHGLCNHQLADQIDELVHLLHIHADAGGLHMRSGRLGCSLLCPCRSWVLR